MILNDARKGIIACIWPAQTRDQSRAAEAFHPTFEFGIRTVRDCGLFANVRADGTLSRATDWALGPRPSIQMHHRTYVQYPRGTHDPPSPRAFKIRVHTVRWHRALSKLPQRDCRAPFADVWARLPARGPAGEHASERTPSGRLPCPGKARAARRADSGRRRQSRASTGGPATD